MIKWTHSTEEMHLESQIADRTVTMARTIGVRLLKVNIVMDIDACHNNGCPLDLQGLLNADDPNFSHDVFGIRQHINRKTGQLEMGFVPRYARPS